MNRDCKCGGHIGSYINMWYLGECVDCHKCYVLENNSWKNITKNEFKVLYREKLIEQQQSNK